MLETEARSENGGRKSHFGQAQIWRTGRHSLTCCAIKRSFDIILPYLEPINKNNGHDEFSSLIVASL